MLVEVLARENGTTDGAPPSHAERLARLAHDYIQEHFRTLSSIEQIATHINISYDHLRHVFRSVYGTSLVGSLQQARIEYAKELLINSPLTIKTIAQACGFRNVRYFSTCFRKYVGTPPGAFRRQ